MISRRSLIGTATALPLLPFARQALSQEVDQGWVEFYVTDGFTVATHEHQTPLVQVDTDDERLREEDRLHAEDTALQRDTLIFQRSSGIVTHFHHPGPANQRPLNTSEDTLIEAVVTRCGLQVVHYDTADHVPHPEQGLTTDLRLGVYSLAGQEWRYHDTMVYGSALGGSNSGWRSSLIANHVARRDHSIAPPAIRIFPAPGLQFVTSVPPGSFSVGASFQFNYSAINGAWWSTFAYSYYLAGYARIASD
jgi:hypothetical protein